MATLADALLGYQPPTTSALADPIVEHFRNLPQTLATNQQAMDNTMAGMYKTDMGTGQPNPNYRPEAMNEFTQMMPMVGALTAWHGTPHAIKGAFDISKVGTGEGAQAYGHGMYFAENPNVAKEYQKIVQGPESAAQHYLQLYKTPEKAIMALEGEITPNLTAEAKKFSQEAINVLKSGKELKGNLYKVDIPDEHIPNMLDWDKPLLQQTPQVQEALAKLGIKTDKQKLSQFDDALLDALMNDANKTLPKQPINPTGQDIYQTFVQGSPQFTSQKLNEAGIRGIRYKDAMSRGGDEGTSNFVVFEPSNVKILEENGIPTRKELIQQQIDKLE